MGSHIGMSSQSDLSLPGVLKLLEDLEKLYNDHESADYLFYVGKDESPVYAHKLILAARCKSFQNLKHGEICLIPGSTVSPSPSPGAPSPIKLPHYNSDMFKHVMRYIYTGKIKLNDCEVFEIILIATELGLYDLKRFFEDHITSTLSVHNVCTIYSSAREMQERLPGTKCSEDFIDICLRFIGDNATECIHTSSFLNLSRDSLKQLLQSDHFALEEEDVWRAILAWAKHRAGVTQPTAHWSEEEKSRVRAQLSGVIDHVRLLLIDSKVFAEEVEPTGAVPLEMSLKRYRAAALPDKFKENSAQPRVTFRFFNGTKILSDEACMYQRVLNQWYGNVKANWRMIYSASQHGFSAETFHNHCDGKAPTYVIIQSNEGNICGGYSDVPWGQTGKYVSSNKAFLFSLTNNTSGSTPQKFQVKKKMFAIAQYPNFGPIFGAGADLCISSYCNENDESYSNLPHSFDGSNASNESLMGDYNFVVRDYEVFALQ